MMKKFTLIGISLFTFILFSGIVSAQNPSYVEELFSYDNGQFDGTTVTELNEGTGWQGEWTLQDGDALTFNIKDGVAEVVGNAKRVFADPLVDSGTEDIWIYTKLRSGTASTAGYAGISLWNGESEDFFIGQEWNKTADAVRGGGWGGANYTTEIDATADVVFLIKIESMGAGEDDAVSVWIDPKIDNAIPGFETMSGTFSYAMPASYEFLSLRSDQTIYCDFIKIGTNIEKILGIGTSAKQFKTSNFNLSNYPNPVKSNLSINYTLKESGSVKIELFDINGKKIKTFSNLNPDAGFHNLRMDTNGITPGIYYYRITQNNSSATKKVVVIE